MWTKTTSRTQAVQIQSTTRSIPSIRFSIHLGESRCTIDRNLCSVKFCEVVVANKGNRTIKDKNSFEMAKTKVSPLRWAWTTCTALGRDLWCHPLPHPLPGPQPLPSMPIYGQNMPPTPIYGPDMPICSSSSQSSMWPTVNYSYLWQTIFFMWYLSFKCVQIHL